MKSQFTKAKAYYLKHIELSERLAKEAQDIELYKNLSDSYDALLTMPKIDSNKNEYKNYCLKFLQIQEFLAKEINDQHRYTLLAFNYNIIYNKLLRLG